MKKFVVAAVAVGLISLCGCSQSADQRLSVVQAAARPDRGPVVNSIVDKFGEPDRDDSTEFANPRPPVVTRFLVYKKERVKFLLMPEAGVSDAPPYKGWRLVGMLDADSGEPLKADAVLRRMGKRVRNP